jgi:hypothetical protein
MEPGKINIDFLDGYILCMINDIATGEGVTASGLFDFYAARISNRCGGLSEYDEKIVDYILAHCRGQKIVEVGAGIGTLSIALALNGVTVLAVEYNLLRARIANRLRAALLGPFPELGPRYEIVFGPYPEMLEGTNWYGPDVTVVFTNLVGGWDDERTSLAIEHSRACGEAILDLRLFGISREDPSDRQALFDRIASQAKKAERLSGLGGDYARFRFPTSP